MKKFTKVLAIIGGIVVVIIAAVFLGTNGVKDAANVVLDQMHNGQIEAVYQNSALANEMTYNDFAMNMGVGTEMSIVNAELQGRNGRGFEGSEKYIYGTFIFANGEEQTLTFWFQEIEDIYIYIYIYILLGITGGIPE